MIQSGLRKKNLFLLYEWFFSHRRNLPFRNTKDPYRIWVSEVMLQQTRMSVVENKYINFIQRFPDLKSLSMADEDEVLTYWKGLGYYSRCRNLQKGAKQIQKQYGGHFPSEWSDALKIPGIGEYTASAVLSIAFNRPHAVLDGNVRRVLSRLYYPLEDSSAVLRNLAEDLMSVRTVDAGFHNESLMELGSLVCKPGIPDCKNCPLSGCCNLKKHGSRLGTLVPPGKKSSPLDIRMHLYIVHDKKKRILIEKKKDRKFFKNMWFFPYAVCEETQSGMKGFEKELPIPEEILADIRMKHVFENSFRHHITHHRIKGNLYWMQCGSVKFKPQDSVYFADLQEVKKLVVSSLSEKVLKILDSNFNI
ncbi:MAG: A/G-specific adenine glycosylase [Spirochaetia bacterium]|nr:A/G-specific adenine glycosylase [Spirochaetia bacterium]